MDENLHNDGLEDFLKKSFDDFEESPSDALWERIDTALVPASSVSLLQVWAAYKWSISAAAVLVLGLMAGQFFYYQNKINKLSESLVATQQQLDNVQQSAKKKSSDTADFSKKELIPEGILLKEAENENLINETATQRAQLSKGIKQSGQSTDNFNGASDIIENSDFVQSAEQAVDQAVIPNAESQKRSNTEEIIGEMDESMPIINRLFPSAVHSNQSMSLGLGNPVVFQTPILVAKTSASTGLFVGGYALPLQLRSNVEVRHSGPLGRRFFNTAPKLKGEAWSTGIRLGLRFNDRWSFWTGAAYKQMQYSSTHRAELVLADRVRRNGIPDISERRRPRFEYDLNTPSGVVAMQVAVEQVDTTVQLQESEPIRMELQHSQKLTYFSVPIMGGVELGNGPLRIKLQGGIWTNFLFDNEFQIDHLRISNPRYRLSRMESPFASQYDLRAVTFDLVAGLGLEYQLNRQFRLSVEPTLVKSLSSTHHNSTINSSTLAAGVGLGVSYSF